MIRMETPLLHVLLPPIRDFDGILCKKMTERCCRFNSVKVSLKHAEVKTDLKAFISVT